MATPTEGIEDSYISQEIFRQAASGRFRESRFNEYPLRPSCGKFLSVVASSRAERLPWVDGRTNSPARRSCVVGGQACFAFFLEGHFRHETYYWHRYQAMRLPAILLIIKRA